MTPEFGKFHNKYFFPLILEIFTWAQLFLHKCHLWQTQRLTQSILVWKHLIFILDFMRSMEESQLEVFQIRENEKSHMCLRKGKRLIPNEVHCLRFQIFPIHPIFLTLTSFLMLHLLHHFTEGIKTKRIKENVFFLSYITLITDRGGSEAAAKTTNT